MSKFTIFVQVQGRSEVVEIELAEGANVGILRAALEAAGIALDAQTAVFIGEAEEHLRGDHEPLHGLKHGARVHVCRCHRVACTVHYTHKTAERPFAPGARVRAVKAWAAQHFGLNHKDAAEHVLQLCGTSDRPASDTPLQQLAHHHCEVKFDLVPEKRVEG